MKKFFLFLFTVVCVSLVNAQTIRERVNKGNDIPAAPYGTPGLASYTLPGKWIQHYYVNKQGAEVLHGVQTLTGAGLADDAEYDIWGRVTYQGTPMKTSITMNFSHGVLNGSYSESYSSVSRKVSGSFKDGLIDGIWTKSISGEVVAKEIWKDGVLKEQWEDGRLLFKVIDGEYYFHYYGRKEPSDFDKDFFINYITKDSKPDEFRIKTAKDFIATHDTLALNYAGYCLANWEADAPGSIIFRDLFVENMLDNVSSVMRKSVYHYKTIEWLDPSYLLGDMIYVTDTTDIKSSTKYTIDDKKTRFYLSNEQYESLLARRDKYYKKLIKSGNLSSLDEFWRDSISYFIAFKDGDKYYLTQHEYENLKNTILENDVLKMLKSEYGKEIESDTIINMGGNAYKCIAKLYDKSVNPLYPSLSKEMYNYTYYYAFYYFKLEDYKVVKDESKMSSYNSEHSLISKYCKRKDATYFEENGKYYIHTEGLKLEISERRKNKMDKK